MLLLKLSLSKIFILPLLLLVPAMLFSQPFIRAIETIPVTVGGLPVAQPFAGGVNAPNHQFVDIDADGDLDLFIFDNDLLLDFYRNEGTPAVPQLKLRPHEISMPPVQIWFLFVDLNGDGKVDLCTDDSGSGVSYYRNDGTEQNPDFVLQTKTMVDSAGDPIFAGFSSVPAFIDLNGDSLIDFLSSNSINGSINYYENVGTTTSPLLKFVSPEFQGITVIGDTCFSSAVRPKRNAHGAGAYSLADVDGNGTPDMFYGDLFSHSIFFIQNIGTSTEPQLQCAGNRYPPDGSLVTFGFNQPTFVDIDGDGDLDLFNGVLNNMQRHGFWHYENIGTTTDPDFQFQTKDYLSVIDAGSHAHPALVDIDNDSDLDLIAGNLDGQLWFFKNNGSQTDPSFDLADTMFAGISGNFTYAPAFVDIDHDGDKDLFIGRFDGRIKFYRNIGSAVVAQFVPAVYGTDNINVSLNAVPSFVDIDNDNDEDLFVGKSNGRINFYRNDGADTGFVPVLVTSDFENIAVGENAKPVFTDADSDGDFDLFVGSSSGKIIFYENTGSAASSQFILQSNHYANTDPMKESDPAFGDIDGDGDTDLLVGTSKGGFHFYRNDLMAGIYPVSELPTTIELLQNYPNPFNPITQFEIRISNFEFVTLKIYDMLGRNIETLIQGELEPGVHSVTWNAVNVASGVYYARLVSNGYTITKKILLTK